MYYLRPTFTEVVAQSVRASDCGSEGRGFEPRLPPRVIRGAIGIPFLFCKIVYQ
jgi:hypothetical protein